jgi:hypothetical protein
LTCDHTLSEKGKNNAGALGIKAFTNCIYAPVLHEKYIKPYRYENHPITGNPIGFGTGGGSSSNFKIGGY